MNNLWEALLEKFEEPKEIFVGVAKNDMNLGDCGTGAPGVNDEVKDVFLIDCGPTSH